MLTIGVMDVLFVIYMIVLVWNAVRTCFAMISAIANILLVGFDDSLGAMASLGIYMAILIVILCIGVWCFPTVDFMYFLKICVGIEAVIALIFVVLYIASRLF